MILPADNEYLSALSYGLTGTEKLHREVREWIANYFALFGDNEEFMREV